MTAMGQISYKTGCTLNMNKNSAIKWLAKHPEDDGPRWHQRR